MKLFCCLVGLTLISISSFAQEDQYKSYQNYDFIAGDKLIFEDIFKDDQLGEFAAHWKLEGGQGVVNEKEGERYFAILKYYSAFTPRLKTTTYLPDDYTIEFDSWLDAGYDSNPGVGIRLTDANSETATVTVSHSQIQLDYMGKTVTGDMPKDIANEAFHNKWHHFAVSVRNGQLKLYCDQYRVVVDPDFTFKAARMSIIGDASSDMNLFFKNVKIADGSGMILVNKLLTESKLVTHAITFDVNQSTVRPESLGIISEMAKFLIANPAITVEVGGHTDADGSDESNLTLSQKRSESVVKLLVEKGVPAKQLIAKGYGETMPLNKNLNFEEKAENRRVEFVKQQ